ncbi:hypothetical protein VKT23_000239 [Stygiomarasmius scandens]|uniref:DUF6593 domain-containing protein n=1 Tax=Marasmiellus scandens TaxID=2682957 RepID=A0ABR1K3W8_9AGAR
MDTSQASIILDFSSDNLRTCDLHLRGTSRTMYEVRTERAFTVTSFRRAGEAEPFAVFERRDLIPDIITFSSRRIRLEKWLKSPAFSSWPVEFEVEGNKYLWMSDDDTVSPRLLLYLRSEANTSLIGWFEGAKYILQDNGPGAKFERIMIPPCIVVLPPAERIVDELIVSAVLLEQKAKWTRGRLSTAQTFGMSDDVAT